MNEHFDEFVSGPRHARQNRIPSRPQHHAPERRHLDMDFDGFFSGPRAAR